MVLAANNADLSAIIIVVVIVAVSCSVTTAVPPRPTTSTTTSSVAPPGAAASVTQPPPAPENAEASRPAVGFRTAPQEVDAGKISAPSASGGLGPQQQQQSPPSLGIRPTSLLPSTLRHPEREREFHDERTTAAEFPARSYREPYRAYSYVPGATTASAGTPAAFGFNDSRRDRYVTADRPQFGFYPPGNEGVAVSPSASESFQRRFGEVAESPELPPSVRPTDGVERRLGLQPPSPPLAGPAKPTVFKLPQLLAVFGKNTYSNPLDPIFRVIFITMFVVLFVWLYAFLITYTTLPTRFFFGIKKDVIRRYVVRLLSYTAQDFINNFQTSFPISGNFLVPAAGVQISRPVVGDVPGFTLDMPSTTITYSWNLAGDLTTKLQALLDSFNEVLKITGGPAPVRRPLRPQRRSIETRDGETFAATSRIADLVKIADKMRSTVGDKCDDSDPAMLMGEKDRELCRRINRAVSLAASLKSKMAPHGDEPPRNQQSGGIAAG